MSLYIKGINLPSDDKLLNIDISSNGEVWVNRGSEWDYYENSVIEIPTPHGKLIDADAIKNVFDKGDTFTAFHFIEAVSEAPTILEAEE